VAVADGYVFSGYSRGKSTNLGAHNWDNAGMNDGIVVKTDLSGNVVWAKNFGGASDDIFERISAAKDGGYLAVGYSYGVSKDLGGQNWGNAGGVDAVAVKLNEDGTVLWAKNFGGISGEYFYGAAATSDGYVLAGYSYGASANLGSQNWGNNGSYDAIAVKIDRVGNVIWSRNIGGAGVDRFNSVAATTDGGYIFAGSSNGAGENEGQTWGNKGGYDALAVKLASDGAPVWAKTFGGDADDFFFGAAESNGGYIFAGRSESVNGNFGNGGNVDAVAVRLSPNGYTEWTANYGGTGVDRFLDVAANGSGLVFAGASDGASTNLGEKNWKNSGALILKTENKFVDIKPCEKIRMRIESGVIVEQNGQRSFIVTGRRTVSGSLRDCLPLNGILDMKDAVDYYGESVVGRGIVLTVMRRSDGKILGVYPLIF
jgi:hypothetical protein